MIKKIILYLLGIILILAACFWAYLFYKRWSSFDIEMPVQSDRVVRINVEQLSKKVFKSGEQKDFTKEGDFSVLKDAVEIPFNIFVFSAKNISNVAYYTKLKINNKASFQKFIDTHFSNGQDSLRHNANGSVSVLFNEQEAILIMGNDTSARVYALANDYLNGKNVISFKESQLYSIKENTADFSSAGNMYNFAINFEQGKIAGTFVSNVQQESNISLKVPENAALAILSKENFFLMLNKLGIRTFYKDINTLDLSSQALEGFALYIDGETQQSKKVTTYEYDDNFEKVAVEKTELATVPNLNIKVSLSNNTTALSTLQQKQVLIGADSVNNEILPLLNLKYFLKNNQTLFVYSSANIDTNIKSSIQLAGEADVIAWIDFKKLANMQTFAELKSYLSIFDKLTINHVQGDSYQLELSFANQQKSSLSQLLSLFKSR